MNYQEAIEFIHSIPWANKKLGLDRIAGLMSAMGDPQKKLKFIHVAGTNGKGSICEMTARILEAAGYTVGVFVSPFIHRFNERMQVNHQPIDDIELASIVTKVKEVAYTLEDMPSVFEMVTATAFQYYYENKCDYVVLEVGMGGRLDATNVIDTPLVAVIATIGFDHTAHLGNTIPEIAYEKAGIIKKGGKVVIYDQGNDALDVFRYKALRVGANLTVADFSQIKKIDEDEDYQYFSYKGSRVYALPFMGAHQLKNASTVLEVAEILKDEGLNIDEDIIETGFRNARWPGRLEIMTKDPLFIVDGGHNPEGARAAIDAISARYPSRTAVIMMGVTKGKDIDTVVRIVDEIAVGFVTIQAETSRAMSQEDLHEILSKYGNEIRTSIDIRDGIVKALEMRKDEEMVLAIGSLYTVAEIRRYFGKAE